MARRGNSNLGWVAIIALIAYAAGRSSSDDPERTETPQAFMSPAPSEYQPAATYAEPEPFVSPQRFVPEERQSAFGNQPFRNCSHARAAGAAPVRAGDPGYGPHLDRDSDGVGCE